MKMATFGPVLSKDEEITSSVIEALKNLGTAPSLAIIYPSITMDIPGIVRIIKSVADVPVIGATTGGAGFTERGYTTNGLVGGFIGGENLVVQAVQIKNISDHLDDTIAATIAQLKTSTQPGHSLFILADAMACDGEAVIKSITKKIPPHWKFFGGLAGDDWTFKGTKVIYNDDVFQGGAVLTYINDGEVPGISARHGFLPFPDSATMKVTSIDGNILHTIDDKPAVQVYTAELERLSVLQKNDDVIKYMAKYPIGVTTLHGERLKIRTPMSIQGDSLVLAGSLQKGDRIRFMYSTTDNLIAAANEMMLQAAKGLNGKTPGAQLVIDCAGRRLLLGDNYKDQVKAFRITPQSPMLGFTSYGEFAKYGGSFEGFHNTTAVTAFW